MPTNNKPSFREVHAEVLRYVPQAKSFMWPAGVAIVNLEDESFLVEGCGTYVTAWRRALKAVRERVK